LGYTPAFFVRVANKGDKSRKWTTVLGMTIGRELIKKERGGGKAKRGN